MCFSRPRRESAGPERIRPGHGNFFWGGYLYRILNINHKRNCDGAGGYTCDFLKEPEGVMLRLLLRNTPAEFGVKL